MTGWLGHRWIDAFQFAISVYPDTWSPLWCVTYLCVSNPLTQWLAILQGKISI